VRILLLLFPAMLAAANLCAQEQPAPAADTARAPALEPPGGNRVFGVLPNYRTADASQEGTVLSVRQKFIIASKDSFDYPLIGLAAEFAALGQLTNQQPSFGQGLMGFGHRLATNYADQALGNLFTEGLFPVLLHEDPRYFRRGSPASARQETTLSSHAKACVQRASAIRQGNPTLLSRRAGFHGSGKCRHSI
jgi:hypothetical protein